MTAEDKAFWNELEPDAIARATDPIVRAMRHKLIIIRLNRINAQDELTGFEILAGTVIRANRDEGFVVELTGAKAGEILRLPLVPDAFSLIDAGHYALSCSTVIRDPDFQAAFDIYHSLS